MIRTTLSVFLNGPLRRELLFGLAVFFLFPGMALASVDEHVINAKRHCDTMVFTANVALFNGGQGKMDGVVRSLKTVIHEGETCLQHIEKVLSDRGANKNMQKEGSQALIHLKEAIRLAEVAVSQPLAGDKRQIMDYARQAWIKSKEGNKHAQEM